MITIVYATETGNSEELATEMADRVKAQGHDCNCHCISEIDLAELNQKQVFLAVVSTWGDGDPPSDAEDIFMAMQDSDPLELTNTHFSVLALGDSYYDEFCKFGSDLEAELIRHKATKLAPRVDCDVDFWDPFEDWAKSVLAELPKVLEPAPAQ